MTSNTESDVRFLTALIASAPVAMYHADATGRLTYANTAYRALFELTADQALDEWAHAVHPEDRERMQQAWADFCRQPHAARFQWRSQSTAGAVRFLVESVAPMSAPAADGFVGTITDVTEYQAIQAQLEKLQRDISGANPALAQLETDLHLAMLLGHLELHYQPKVDMLTGTIQGAEALIRWRDPKRGLIPPAEFIPLAEASKLIGAIGEWVIRKACKQTRAWQDAGFAAIRVAVNLSPAQFRHGDLTAIIRQALDDAGLDPRFLEVELTENTVMNDAEGSVVILERLSQMGILVSVDDFGTGYSSLTYLRRFPVDKLKIDRIFINEITSRSEDASIVRAIISLAHSMRLKVVAEGVETREQLEFLQALGCDQYQGYYFSPAVPPAQFAALLRDSARNDQSFMNDAAARTHSKLATYRR
jgi:PAS domain S-box-containing protein